MKLVNITPHALTIHNTNGGKSSIVTLPVSGIVARCAVKTEECGNINGIDYFTNTIGDIVGLPEKEEGTRFVASLIVAQKAFSLGRMDVYSPGELIRDEKGNPIGCKGLNIPM